MTANTAELTREDLERRKKYMGASDAPAAMGLSSFKTPIELVNEKKSPVPEVIETSDACRRGHLLEPVVARIYEQDTGNKLAPAMHTVHPHYDFMSATPDRIVDGTNGLLEIKTHVDWLAKQYSDGHEPRELDENACPTNPEDVPPYEYVQVQHQMACTGADFVDVCVLFGSTQALSILAKVAACGNMDVGTLASLTYENLEVRYFRFYRDDEFIETLIEQEQEFWNRYIIGDEIPTDIKMCVDSGGIREASVEESCKVDDLRSAYIGLKKAEELYSAMREEVEDCIGVDSGISSSNGKITWKKGKDKTKTDWKKVKAAAPDLVKKHTTTVPGSRSFRVPTGKWNEFV
jgi:putative phage-type endonuclease